MVVASVLAPMLSLLQVVVVVGCCCCVVTKSEVSNSVFNLSPPLLLLPPLPPLVLLTITVPGVSLLLAIRLVVVVPMNGSIGLTSTIREFVGVEPELLLQLTWLHTVGTTPVRCCMVSWKEARETRVCMSRWLLVLCGACVNCLSC